MDFGDVIKAMKSDPTRRFARKGWNGKNMHIYLTVGLLYLPMNGMVLLPMRKASAVRSSYSPMSTCILRRARGSSVG